MTEAITLYRGSDVAGYVIKHRTFRRDTDFSLFQPQCSNNLTKFICAQISRFITATMTTEVLHMTELTRSKTLIITDN